MDLKVTRTFALELSEQEVRVILEEPADFLHYLSVALDDDPTPMSLTAKIRREPRRPKAKARKGAGTARMLTRKPPKMRTCPHCGEEKKGQGYARHEASCAIKHAPSAGDLSTPATP
jgi:hypothetical protein